MRPARRFAASAGSSTTPPVLTSPTEEGSLAQHTDGNQEQALSAQTVVTAAQPAGNHEFSLACEEDVGDMDFTDIRISAVLLGSG
jgi:hypothetical protein